MSNKRLGRGAVGDNLLQRCEMSTYHLGTTGTRGCSLIATKEEAERTYLSRYDQPSLNSEGD